MLARTMVVSLALAVLLSSVPAVAQHQGHTTIDGVDNTLRISDAPTDVGVYVAPRQNPQPQNGSATNNFDHIDILQVVFGEETENDFRIGLKLKSLTNSNPTGFAFRAINFDYGKVRWTVYWGTCGAEPPAPKPTKGCLRFAQGGFTQRGARQFDVEFKEAESTVVFPIPKTWLYNENRVPARFGTQLANVSAVGFHFYAGIFFVPGGDPTGGVAARDNAPNTGVHAAPFQMLRGTNSHGHLAIDAVSPIRVSNGEATTIVFRLDIYNHHLEPFNVQMDAVDVRPDWTVRVPAVVDVPASSKISIPVILSLPFTHDHGKTVTFKVKAQALEDQASYGETDLGVYWTEIPQPSGHHETDDGGTFFHSGTVPNERIHDAAEGVVPTYQMWMNGIADDPDPAATDVNIPSGFNEYFACLFPNGGLTPGVPNCQAPPTFVASWFFPLSPPLLMGLDFDLSKKGVLTMEIANELPAQNARLLARLMMCDPAAATSGSGLCALNQTTIGGGGCPRGYGLEVARGQGGGSLSVNGQTAFTVELAVDPKYDLILFKPGINIGLCIQLLTDTPENLAGTEPRPEFVTKKARLRLPLLEYHDPVDQEFANVGALGIIAHSPFEKAVNPGRNTIFKFDVVSNASSERRVQLEVQGVNSDWSQIIGPYNVVVPPGGKRSIELMVSPPVDASGEERAELFLVAQDQADASVVAVTRLRATVVEVARQDIPDEQPSGASGKDGGDTPGLDLVVVTLAVLVPLVRRRRLP